MLVRCLYASRSIKPIDRAVLDEILVQSRAKNIKRGVTGLLCFSKDIYLQVIEGGRSDVGALYNDIVRDSRHHGVCLLVYEEISERRFGNWTMGQVGLDSVNPALLLKYSERAELDPFSSSGHSTMALLSDLLATGSIAGRGGA